MTDKELKQAKWWRSAWYFSVIGQILGLIAAIYLHDWAIGIWAVIWAIVGLIIARIHAKRIEKHEDNQC